MPQLLQKVPSRRLVDCKEKKFKLHKMLNFSLFGDFMSSYWICHNLNESQTRRTDSLGTSFYPELFMKYCKEEQKERRGNVGLRVDLNLSPVLHPLNFKLLNCVSLQHKVICIIDLSGIQVTRTCQVLRCVYN